MFSASACFSIRRRIRYRSRSNSSSSTAVGVADDDLLDLGAGGGRLLAQHRGVDGHLAPAADGVAEAQHLALDDGPAGLLLLEAGARQEHHADGDPLVGADSALDLALEEVLRDLDVDAGAVAGLAVGVDRTAVPDRLERLDPLDHDLAPRLAVDGDDAAHPAGVALVGRVVEAVLGQMARIGRPARDELGPTLMLAHRASPQEARARDSGASAPAAR